MQVLCGLQGIFLLFNCQTPVPYEVPEGCRCIISNYNEDIKPEKLRLRPYEAVMFLKDK